MRAPSDFYLFIFLLHGHNEVINKYARAINAFSGRAAAKFRSERSADWDELLPANLIWDAAHFWHKQANTRDSAD